VRAVRHSSGLAILGRLIGVLLRLRCAYVDW
jgi:hypothetical protein